MQDFIAKAKKKVAQVELYQTSVTETPVRYENNHLKGIETNSHRVTALRVVKDGKLGFATSTGTDLDQLLDMAIATAQFGRPWDIPLAGPADLPQVELSHPSTQVELDAMVEMGLKIIERLRRCHPQVLASTDLSTVEKKTKLVNSQGFSAQYSKTLFSLLGFVELTQDKNMLTIFAGANTGKLEDQVEKTVNFLVENFEHGLNNVPIKSGEYTVIFSPQGLGDILRPLLACANGKAVEKGFSPWKDKLGEQLFSQQVSLYDDATIPYAPASCLFDGEGMAANRTAIIQDGKVNSFILDMATAQALGMKSTGNGFRSPDDLPTPRNSNVVLDVAATQPLPELVGSVEKGIIIHSMMGAWAGNPYSGQVSGNVDLGFVIQDGKITGRVKDCMMSVNTFDAFRDQIIAASNEKEWAWNMHLPHLKLKNVSISTKS